VNTTLVLEPSSWVANLHAALSEIPIDKWNLIAPVQRQLWAPTIGLPVTLEPYASQFSEIQAQVAGSDHSVPLSFLDYASTESVLRDVVYIDADGNIELPGHLSGLQGPFAERTHINADDAPERITDAVQRFEAAGRPVQ